MSLPTYPAYKDSDVAWLGEVPEHWELKRLKHCFRLLTEKTNRRENPVALENVESWSGRFIKTETAYEGDGVAFERGDILFGKLRPYLAKAYLTENQGEAIGDFHVLRPKGAIYSRFSQYQILNREFIDVVDGSTFGAKMPRVSWDFLGNIILTVPPYEEQSIIANFLDRETTKIDELIAEQQRLIKLLKEKRQAVISHAVTKGLNPDAPMKDSGIEWLGEVPEHWEITLLKHIIANIESGTSVNSTDTPVNGDGYGVLKTSCVYDGEFDAGQNKAIVASEYDRASCPLRLNSLIVSRMNTPDLVGAAGLVRQERSNLFLPDRLWQVTFYTANLAFVHYWTLTTYYRSQVKMVCTGTSSSMQNLGQDQFRSFIFPLPPVQEQSTIAAFLDRETAKFDELIAEAQRAITLLQERRTALISAAVTGKIDVRSLVSD